MDQLEESMSKAEKELDPNKLRKVFSAIPGLVSKIGPFVAWLRLKHFPCDLVTSLLIQYFYVHELKPMVPFVRLHVYVRSDY